MSIRQGQTIIAKTGLMSGSSSYKGEYSDTTVYNTGDYVKNGSDFYICLKDNTIGHFTNELFYWTQLNDSYLVGYDKTEDGESYQLGLVPSDVQDSNRSGRIHVSVNAPKVNASTGEIVGYAKTEDLPTKVSELENDSGYLTEHQDLTDYALKSELPIVPTNVSAFTNDSGYLTSHQDISGKADKSDTYTKSEVDAKVSSVYRFKGSVANYDALPTSDLVVGDVYNIESNGSNYAWDGNDWDKLSETINLTPYLTKNEASTTYATINDVNGEIATLEGSIGNKADKTAIPTKTSQLTNDSGYLTSHQDISGKANTSLNNLTTVGNEYIDNRIGLYQPKITTLSATSGTINLEVNKVYTMAISGTTTFSLATPTNKNVFNQIKVIIKVTGTPTINWGTTYFFNKKKPSIEEGSYDIYFDYDNLLNSWVCGSIPKGTIS